MNALRWGRVVKKILMKNFGVATFMLKPEDIKKNLIRLRWSRVLKKIKSLNSGAAAFGLSATA